MLYFFAHTTKLSCILFCSLNLILFLVDTCRWQNFMRIGFAFWNSFIKRKCLSRPAPRRPLLSRAGECCQCGWFPFDIDDVYLFRWKWKIYKIYIHTCTDMCVRLFDTYWYLVNCCCRVWFSSYCFLFLCVVLFFFYNIMFYSQETLMKAHPDRLMCLKPHLYMGLSTDFHLIFCALSAGQVWLIWKRDWLPTELIDLWVVSHVQMKYFLRKYLYLCSFVLCVFVKPKAYKVVGAFVGLWKYLNLKLQPIKQFSNQKLLFCQFWVDVCNF